jgi:uncharacterized membrane protein
VDAHPGRRAGAHPLGRERHPDRWAGRLEALAAGPLTAVGMAALLWVVTRIDPRCGHLARSARTYNAIWISVLVVVTVSHAVAVLAATGRHVAVGPAVTAAVGVMLLVIGNYLPKLRSSWFTGVRTPWTLSSELSWHRTHRLAGRLLAALGLLVLASAFLLGGDGQAAVLVGGLAVVLAVLVPYSWWVWRSDPGRQTIGRA